MLDGARVAASVATLPHPDLHHFQPNGWMEKESEFGVGGKQVRKIQGMEGGPAS